MCQKTSAQQKKKKKIEKNIKGKADKKICLPSNENNNCCDDCSEEYETTKGTERND